MTILLVIVIALTQWMMIWRISFKLAIVSVVFVSICGILVLIYNPSLLQTKRVMHHKWTQIQDSELTNQTNKQMVVHQLYQDYLRQAQALEQRSISWPRLRYTQAKALHYIGDLSASIEILQELYHASQTETQVGYLLAQLLLERSASEDLLALGKLLNNIERIGGKSFALLMLKTEYFIAMQETEKAVDALLQGIDFAPDQQSRLQIMQYAGILKSQLKPFQPIELIVSWPPFNGQQGSLLVTAELEHGPEVPLAKRAMVLEAMQLITGGIKLTLGTEHQIVPSYNLALATERNAIVKFNIQLTTDSENFTGTTAVELNEQLKSINLPISISK